MFTNHSWDVHQRDIDYLRSRSAKNLGWVYPEMGVLQKPQFMAQTRIPGANDRKLDVCGLHVPLFHHFAQKNHFWNDGFGFAADEFMLSRSQGLIISWKRLAMTCHDYRSVHLVKFSPSFFFRGFRCFWCSVWRVWRSCEKPKFQVSLACRTPYFQHPPIIHHHY
jgi:hypothetical protein